MHVKDLNETLISVSQMCDKGNIVLFTKDESIILNITKFRVNKGDNVKIIPRNHEAGLYESKDLSLKIEKACTAELSTDGNLWHQRLVHTNVKVLKSMEQTVQYLSKLSGNLHACHPCLLGKAKKKCFHYHFE